jgi:5S rRNA maturation endonuclease (ribonuclease M5)
MLTTIQDQVKTLLPAKRKVNATSGWISFNAPCCVYNGESADTRGRGGVMAKADGSVSYHCFNCHFKASYQPGRHLTFKFRKLLGWLGADDGTIKKMVIDAIRVRDLVSPEQIKPQTDEEEVKFNPRPLPSDAKTFEQWTSWFALSTTSDSGKITVPKDFFLAITYANERKVDHIKYNLMWSPESEHNYHKRVIIPCYWKGELIGSTSRACMDGMKPKYYADYDSNYVFNLDNQLAESKFVIIVEGPFDAMSVDGVAVMSNECSEVQADIIDSLGKEVIVVPDFDVKMVRGHKVWSGESLVEQAMNYGWAVSFPEWREEVKDTAEAVEKYGKLFTIKAIIEGKLTSKLKIELMRKRILG